MRATERGSVILVQATKADVEAFKSRWPAPGPMPATLWAEFDKRNGDLLDLSTKRDSAAITALVADMGDFARQQGFLTNPRKRSEKLEAGNSMLGLLSPDERFFFDRASWSHREGASDLEKRASRMGSARHLAAAEAWARNRGDLEFVWEDDPDGADTLGDIDPATVSEILQCTLYWSDPSRSRLKLTRRVLASLGGIVDPDRAYRRIIEAELALEAYNEEERK